MLEKSSPCTPISPLVAFLTLVGICVHLPGARHSRLNKHVELAPGCLEKPRSQGAVGTALVFFISHPYDSAETKLDSPWVGADCYLEAETVTQNGGVMAHF